MSAKIEKYIELLRLYRKATPAQRKLLLEVANNDFIQTLCECCHNANLGNVPLKPKTKRKLKKFAPVMRKIASRNDKYKRIGHKRKLLIQEGGFLPALLTPIIGLIGGLVGELVGKKL
jgi:hypothetical protein